MANRNKTKQRLDQPLQCSPPVFVAREEAAFRRGEGPKTGTAVQERKG